MKIIVTGAHGQLGCEIKRQSRYSEHTFVFTDVDQLDITDRDAVAKAITPETDVIINCAAYTDVNAAETDHEAAEKVNVLGPKVLAEAAAAADALLIHISTDYVFDGKANVPYTEEQTPDPVNYYGRTKLLAEQEIVNSGCRYMIFRSSWLYSIHGRNFFLTMENLTSSKPEVKVVNDQTGTPTSAADLASMICNVIEENQLDLTGIYNYSNEGTCTWYDFAKAINDLLGHACRIVPCRTDEFPTPAERPAYTVLDKTKVKNTFNIEVPYWRDSLELVIKDYLENHE